MKYFRVVNPDDITEEFYVSCSEDFEPERVKEQLGLEQYWLAECSKEEFEAMTQEVNDYIINVGHDEDSLTPFDSAHTYEEGIEKGEKYLEDWEFVELVYMPQADCDVNTVVWFKSR